MVKKNVKKAAHSVRKQKSRPQHRPAHRTNADSLAWLTPSRIKEIRNDLVRMRDDILRTVRKQTVDDVDNGDSVDQASQSIEKELMFELSDNERTTLDMVEAAIRKIDNGTYGLC